MFFLAYNELEFSLTPVYQIQSIVRIHAKYVINTDVEKRSKCFMVEDTYVCKFVERTIV